MVFWLCGCNDRRFVARRSLHTFGEVAGGDLLLDVLDRYDERWASNVPVLIGAFCFHAVEKDSEQAALYLLRA